ncbi:MAG: hypothetical protein RL391_310 [Actinomycetota bacterium]|jgi:hypothetical protein
MNQRAIGLLALAFATSFVLPAAPTRAMPDDVVVSLIAQDQFVAGVEDSVFNVSLLIDSPDTAPTIGRMTASITSYRPVRNRQEVHAVIDGEMTSVVDSIEVPIVVTTATDSKVADIAVPIEIGRRTRDRLQMSATGLYPISISLLVDDVSVDSVTTFIDRLPEGDAEPEPVSPLVTAIVGEVDGGPTLRADSTTFVADTDRQTVSELIVALDSTSGTPLSVALRPELIEGFARSTSEDADLYAQLQFADSIDLLSTTFVDLDPTSSMAANYGDIFTNQLRLGEDALAAALPQTSPVRTTWLQSGPLSAAGARFIRDLGFRSITLLPSLLDTGSIDDLGFVDSTRLVDLDLSNGGRISGLIADPLMAEIISEPTADEPFLAAQYVLADLTILRRDIIDRGEDMSGRALILSTRDGRLPGADLVASLVDTLGASGQVSFVSIDEALATSRVGLADGRPITIELPFDEDPTPSNLGTIMERAESRIAGFVSMLPDGDERPSMWRRVLDVIPDQDLSNEQRESYLQIVVEETQRLADSVAAPIPTTFTLGGRNSSIRLSIRNDSDTELQVRVRLSSSKLRFPQGEQVLAIPGGTVASVEVPVRARTNGRFPVSLQLLTPEGDIPLSPVTVFTARVNALAGLGQLVTGVALLLLATWWIAHFRRQHRSRQEGVADTSSRHPSGEPPPRPKP